MTAKKKTPKLICKTPVLLLHRLEGTWCSDRGREWICANKLGYLFHIPDGVKKIRACLYDGNIPGGDALRIRFKNGWRIGWTIRAGDCLSGLMWDSVETLLSKTLFAGNEEGDHVMKSAWLEIEIED